MLLKFLDNTEAVNASFWFNLLIVGNVDILSHIKAEQ